MECFSLDCKGIEWMWEKATHNDLKKEFKAKKTDKCNGTESFYDNY